jgi:outer membrane protein OmpA-like peptidoglycan-associated protein
VGEGILITFDSGLLFEIDSDELRAKTRENLEKMPEILEEYEDTELLIEGHTDAVGSHDYNQALSRDWAQSVAQYLNGRGVDRARMIVKGYGEEQPVADNDTEGGRQQNRRVEIAIYADEDLKARAKGGNLNPNG